MSECCTEGYAVTEKFDREIVAIFTSRLSAESYISRVYKEGKNDSWKPEINHVFFGVEAF